MTLASVFVRIRPVRSPVFFLFVSIIAVGASHRSAPLSLLEQLSVSPGGLEHLLSRLKPLVAEGFVLSTCNRTEICAVAGDGSAAIGDALIELLAERAGIAAAGIARSFYCLTDDAAIRHVLRVASGLESMVLGEDHIQAQLKRALAAARGAEILGPTLERLGAMALSCGKRVRTFTGVGQHSVSLESLAVEVALSQAGPLGDGEVVVLGSGTSARIVVRQLRSLGVPVLVVGRTYHSASALATEADATCLPWEQLAEALVPARVIFSCTSAPHPILMVETLSRRLRERGDVPLLCVDIGMPRDVDAAVQLLAGVSSIRLDQLGVMAAQHRAARERHVPAADAIVERELARFSEWQRVRGAAGQIVERRARAQAVADLELKRALARLQTTSAHDRAVLADLTRRLVRKLMHEETEALRADATHIVKEVAS